MDCPAVYKHGSRTAILVEVGRKNVRYIPMREGELTVKNIAAKEFEQKYNLFDYPIGNAARKYLGFSKFHGITERARSFLMSIADAHPEVDTKTRVELLDERKTTMAEKKAVTKAAPEPAPKTEKAAPKAEKPKAAPKVEKATPKADASRQGRKSAFEPGMKITVLVDKNPKRGPAAARFELYAKNKTVEKYLAAGGQVADLRWDSKQGWIKVE